VDEAIAQYQKALQINPDHAQAHYNLGIALLEKDRVDEAIVQYQKALETDPDSAQTHNNLASALMQKGRVDEAIVQYQKALEIRPNYVEAYNNLGNALFQKGRVDEAIAHYQKALAIQPDYAIAHNSLGLALLQKGQVDEAINCFQQALVIQPNYVKAQNNLAWVLATSPEASVRNGTRAVDLAQQADRSCNGNNPVVAKTLAAAYAEAGRFPEAMDTARRAQQLAASQSDPDLANALQAQIELYQMGSPFRDVAQTNTPAPPGPP
jgi:tetratricopeptide (TPR) repeat protein